MNTIKNLQKLAPNEKEAILEFVTLLRQKLGTIIKEIVLFGSKVRGSSVTDSDIDILIVLTKLSWEIKKTISELAAQENMKYEVVISTIRYHINTWENPIIMSSPFGKIVRDEGIRL